MYSQERNAIQQAPHLTTNLVITLVGIDILSQLNIMGSEVNTPHFNLLIGPYAYQPLPPWSVLLQPHSHIYMKCVWVSGFLIPRPYHNLQCESIASCPCLDTRLVLVPMSGYEASPRAHVWIRG